MSEPHSPAWHFEQAEQLLARAAESSPIDEAVYVESVTRRAMVHAILATTHPDRPY